MTMSSSLPPENSKPSSSKQMSSGPLAVAKSLIGIFSTVRQRDPPSQDKTTHIRLITIAVSHYCEKVRWALDHVEARDESPYYYTEDGHPPGFHAYETLKATKEEASITPMIVVEEHGKREVLYDSVQILKRLMPELYPQEIQAQVEEMEADLGKRVGAAVRCFAYYNFLTQQVDNKKYHDTFVSFVADERKVARIEHVIFDRFLDKGLGKGILEALQINADTAVASLQAIRSVFSELSRKLEESGGEYILDSSTNNKSYGFTAADLTLAALAYPLLRPPEMHFWLADMEDIPDEINSLTKELVATKAGQHVLKMYKEHRIATKDSGDGVLMKQANRNKYPWEGISLWWPVCLLFGVGAAAAAMAYAT
jgi:glutathione S-transferase